MLAFSSRFAATLLVLAALTKAQSLDATLNAALRDGRHAEALRLADELLRTSPKDAALWTARGLALDGTGRGHEALASFDRALAISPKFVPALRAGAQIAYLRKDSRAEGYLQRLLTLEPENAIVHGMAAVAAYERSDCDKAASHFLNAGSRIQADPLAASMYAQCLLRLGRASQAVNTLSAGLSLNPSSKDLRYNLAVAQSAAGDTAAALKTLEPLTSSAGALSLLGTLRAESGDLEGALVALRDAVRLAPDDEQPYVELALLCTRMSSWSQAREVSDEGLKRVPGSTRLHSIRGVCRLQLGDSDGAATDFDEADRLEPGRGLGAAAQGFMLSLQGRPEEAVSRLRDALTKKSSDAMLQFLLATALDRAGIAEKEGAIGLLESAIRTRPGFAQAHALLGKLRLRRGETREAIREFETALRLEPANRQAAQQLIIALRQIGRASEAEGVAANLRNHLKSKQPSTLIIEAPSR